MSNIILYSKEQCPGCVQVKDFLNLNGMEYTVRDVVKEPQARLALMQAGFMSVPVADIDGIMFVGPESIIKKLSE